LYFHYHYLLERMRHPCFAILPVDFFAFILFLAKVCPSALRSQRTKQNKSRGQTQKTHGFFFGPWRDSPRPFVWVGYSSTRCDSGKKATLMEKSEKITECTMATDICDIRDQIDAIDNTILELINRRLNLARRIGELKKKQWKPGR